MHHRAVFALLVLHQCALSQVQWSLSKLAREIVRRGFEDARCVVLVTTHDDQSPSLLRGEVPVYNLLHPRGASVQSAGTEVAFNSDVTRRAWLAGEHSLELTLLHTLNQGCEGYLVSTRDPAAMLSLLARLARKSTSRSTRTVVFLPAEREGHQPPPCFDESSLLVMDLMPDVYFVRPTGCREDTCHSGISTSLSESSHSDISAPHCSDGKTGENAELHEDGKLCFLVPDIQTESKKKRRMEIGDKTASEPGFPNGYPCNESLEEEEFEIITHKFSAPDPYAPVTVSTWPSGVADSAAGSFFPDKLADLKGKQLRVASFSYVPFMLVDLQTPDGSELRIVQEFARKLNFTWQLVVEEEHLWGEAWENGSGNGLVGSVLEDKADIAFCGTYSWFDHYRYVDFTHTYYPSAITLVVPKPRLLPAWIVPVLPFSAGTWLAVATSLVITSAALWCVHKAAAACLDTSLRGNENAMSSTYLNCSLVIMGLLVLQVPPNNYTKTQRDVPMRHLLLWLVTFYFIVASSYSGGLASVLTVPRYGPPVDTLKDLADSNYLWGAPHEAYIYSIKDVDEPIYKTIVKNFRVHNEYVLRHKSVTSALGLPVERLSAGHLAIGEFITEENIRHLRIMKENLYSGNIVMLLRKGSPFMEKLNKLIDSLLESGILQYWEGTLLREFQSQRLHIAVATSGAKPNEGPVQLRAQHVAGAMFILCIGLTLSFIVFILEIFWAGRFKKSL